jgi:DNA invertase Pin-like site-specific DNA recombinase
MAVSIVSTSKYLSITGNRLEFSYNTVYHIMSSLGYVEKWEKALSSPQNPDLQIDALQKEGVEKGNIFTDYISGSKFERPGLDALPEKLQIGDVLVVWKFDRIGRSLKDLINLADTLEKRGVDIRSIQDKIDTTTPMGKLMFHINCAHAEPERDTIRERTRARLTAVRSRGRMGGRSNKLSKTASFSEINSG